jgi:hypothetical protein
MIEILKFALFANCLVLALACLCALHVPRRPTDRGGFE